MVLHSYCYLTLSARIDRSKYWVKPYGHLSNVTIHGIYFWQKATSNDYPPSHGDRSICDLGISRPLYYALSECHWLHPSGSQQTSWIHLKAISVSQMRLISGRIILDHSQRYIQEMMVMILSDKKPRELNANIAIKERVSCETKALSNRNRKSKRLAVSVVNY